MPETRLPLLLGAVGFERGELEALTRRVRQASVGGMAWSVGDFESPDAWLVNGSMTRPCGPEEIEVIASARSAPVRFALAQVDRPIAFSTPLACPEFEPACTFDPESTSSMVVLLSKLTQWLRPKAMLLSLAALVAQRRSHLEAGRIYQVIAKDKLVAVVNLAGDSGVLRGATWRELEEGAWVARPASADYVPEVFARESTRALLWQYATRTAADLLPVRYRLAPIHLRRLPAVPQRLLGDAQLVILRELSQGSRTLRQLAECARLSPAEACRELAPLYVVGAITTSQRKASWAAREAGGVSSWPVSSILGADATAPGAMMPAGSMP